MSQQKKSSKGTKIGAAMRARMEMTEADDAETSVLGTALDASGSTDQNETAPVRGGGPEEMSTNPAVPAEDDEAKSVNQGQVAPVGKAALSEARADEPGATTVAAGQDPPAAATPDEAPRDVAPTSPPLVGGGGGEALESFNTRLPRRVLRRLKLYSVQHDKKIQTVVLEALEAFLKESK